MKTKKIGLGEYANIPTAIRLHYAAVSCWPEWDDNTIIIRWANFVDCWRWDAGNQNFRLVNQRLSTFVHPIGETR